MTVQTVGPGRVGPGHTPVWGWFAARQMHARSVGPAGFYFVLAGKKEGKGKRRLSLAVLRSISLVSPKFLAVLLFRKCTVCGKRKRNWIYFDRAPAEPPPKHR